MNAPSSTITAATIAGASVTFVWAMVDQFTSIDPNAVLVASSVTLVSMVVGYFKKERVLNIKRRLP